MADDILLNAGTGGDTIAADDIVGIKYQRVKLTLGADATNDGDVASGNPMPVTGTVAVTNAGLTELAAAINGSSQMDVNLAASAATITVAAHAVTNAGTFATQVDGAALTALQVIDNPVLVDDAAFTPATSSLMMAGFEFDDTLPDSVDEGDAGAARMSANRNVYVQVRDAAGNERGLNIDANNAIAVTNAGLTELAAAINGSSQMDVNVAAGTVAVTNAGLTELAAAINVSSQMDVNIAASAATVSVNPGTAANFGVYVEDAAETAGGNLSMAGSVRRDTAASSAGTTGDNATINTDALGKLWTTGSYAEDTAHTAADVLTAVATRRIDTAASSAGTSGDYATLDTSAEGAVWVTLTPTTTSGCSIFRSIDLDETEEEIKATAGNVYGYYVYNAAATAHYLKFYNATAANTTVGTTTPVATFPIPATSAANVSFDNPMGFGTAITVAATTGLADADTGAPAANAVIVNILFK